MNFVLKVILLLLGVLALVVLIVWGYINYWFATKQVDRDIASGLNIGPDWVEIVPQPPLKVEKDLQYLILVVDGDKQRVDPEVEIVDENGNVQSLEPSSLLLDSSLSYRHEFRKDQVLTRVRIRSKTPFQCARVIWHCFNMK